MLFKIAVKQSDDGLVRNVDWWPSLVRATNGPGKVYDWLLIPLEIRVRDFLVQHTETPMRQWRAWGAKMLAEYMVDYADEDKFVIAMMFLIASKPDLLNSILARMKNLGYDFGEYDKTDPLP